MSYHLVEQIRNWLKQTQSTDSIPLLTIIGPTASGKTSLSIALGNQFNAEIVSADSRQIYKEMDIGTAKASVEEMRQIPHYLIDIVYPNQDFSLAHYKKYAEQTIREIHSRRKLPILVGGTGLYISAIAEQYALPEVPPNPELREKLENYAAQHGPEALHQQLQEFDSQAASQIHPNNIRYVIRALEIYKAQGIRKLLNNTPYSTFIVNLDWPRDELYQRIDQRIDQQIEQGLIAETKRLLSKYSPNLPAMSSLGYQELAIYLKGDLSLNEAVEIFKKNTRNYAKRQLTWFRRFKDVYLLPGSEIESLINTINY